MKGCLLDQQETVLSDGRLRNLKDLKPHSGSFMYITVKSQLKAPLC